MKPLIDALLRIQTLRRHHTEAFKDQDGDKMQRLDVQIALSWAGYNDREQQAIEAGVCFSCGKPSFKEHAVNRKDRQQLFCSANCRRRFGITLGLT